MSQLLEKTIKLKRLTFCTASAKVFPKKKLFACNFPDTSNTCTFPYLETLLRANMLHFIRNVKSLFQISTPTLFPYRSLFLVHDPAHV